MYIENINGPEDVKKLTIDQLPTLAEEIRHALLLRASRHMGHLDKLWYGGGNNCTSLCI